MNAKVSATKVCPGCSARYPPDALFCPNDGSPLTATPLGARDHDGEPAAPGETHDSYLGQEISGHIEIQRLAGVGAMGRVYRAFQRGIERDVAVKILHRELSANQQLVARFHREAKVASRLQHPNVVQVHLAGQLADGAMYIVMEYLDGLSLHGALVAAGGPLPLVRALHIALQICDAAGEAHSQGVVHRDIKPENVMLVRRGDDPDFVKVLDFGIARLNWGEQSMATAAGLIFGTARYISPEGAQGEAVGPEGDVYATATLLYQMLAGRTPFEGEQAVALLVQQIHDAPPPLRSLPAGANVPEAIASVIMQNLSKSPAERSSDARSFGRALVDAAKSIGLTPEDLVPRSSLFAPHARLSEPSPVLGAAGSPAAAVRVEPARTPPVPDVAAMLGPAASLPPGTKTQAWSPPAAGSRDGASGLSPTPPPPGHAVVPAPAPPYVSSVDRTLDDSSALRVRGVSPGGPTAAPVKTEPALLPLPRPHEAPPTSLTPPTQASPALPAYRPVGAARPVPFATLDDDSPRANASPGQTGPRRAGSRLFTVVLACFLLGMAGASIALYQLGWFGGASRSSSLDDAVTRADDALRHGRWDAPAGDNVRDITTEALAKWPGEPRLVDLRARATDELVKDAVGRKFAGDLPAALHLARLAFELDPTDTTARHLVDDYERAAKAGRVDAAATASGSTGTVATAPRSGGTRPPPPGSSTAAKAAVESSLAHPKVGQPVTFTAKVSLPAGPVRPIEEPRFVINGPGLTPDTKLGAIPQPGALYATNFAGSLPGKYEVTFDARVDGLAVRATKAFVIEGGAPAPSSSAVPPLPPPSTSTAPPVPSTVPSGKWL